MKSCWLSLLSIALVAGWAPAAGTQLSPGKYVATLTPRVDEKTADKIEKQLGQIQEIGSIDVKPRDSSLHFTVKDKAQADLTRIDDAVKTAAPGTAVTEPVMESASSTPGGPAAETSPTHSY